MTTNPDQFQAAGFAAAGEVSHDARAMMMFQAGQKSLLVSYLLWFFLGGLGGHRFYNGRAGSALAQIGLLFLAFVMLVGGVAAGGTNGGWIGAPVGILLALAVALWILVDAFLIPGWVRRTNEQLAGRLASR